MTRSPDGQLYPPSGGHPPPVEAKLTSGETLYLMPLAQEICRRYREEFPDEEARYGDAGNAWCVHDNQHLLNWAVGTVQGHIAMDTQVDWLAGILEAREFPLDRLARNLEIGADVIVERVAAPHGQLISSVLADAAACVRDRPANST